MALHERKNPEDWNERGRFYYVGMSDSGMVTYQVDKKLGQEFVNKGYKEGKTFKRYKISSWLKDGLFYTLGDADPGDESFGAVDGEKADYAEDAPRAFHARVKLNSKLVKSGETVWATLLEWPPCVLVLDDAKSWDQLEQRYDLDEFTDNEIPMPCRFRLRIGFYEHVPTCDEYVRILESSRDDTDATFICRRPIPRSGEVFFDRQGNEYVVSDFLEDEEIKLSKNGASRWFDYRKIVGQGEKLQATMPDNYWGDRLVWRVVPIERSPDNWTDEEIARVCEAIGMHLPEQPGSARLIAKGWTDEDMREVATKALDNDLSIAEAVELFDHSMRLQNTEKAGLEVIGSDN